MCVASLLCGPLNLALTGVHGETKLNVYDTVAYMAIPAALFLMPIAGFYEKKVPGQWVVSSAQTITDWQVRRSTWAFCKVTMAGWSCRPFSFFMYNIIQLPSVHTLSPSVTADGGNFHKEVDLELTMWRSGCSM